jgi:hypothetical protein
VYDDVYVGVVRYMYVYVSLTTPLPHLCVGLIHMCHRDRGFNTDVYHRDRGLIQMCIEMGGLNTYIESVGLIVCVWVNVL